MEIFDQGCPMPIKPESKNKNISTINKLLCDNNVKEKVFDLVFQ